MAEILMKSIKYLEAQNNWGAEVFFSLTSKVDKILTPFFNNPIISIEELKTSRGILDWKLD